MDPGPRQQFEAPEGLLRIEDCFDEHGGVALPAGATLISLIERNIANVGDSVLDVVQALSEAWADVDAVAPIDVQLYDKDDSPPGSSGVTLTEGSNITSLSLTSEI